MFKLLALCAMIAVVVALPGGFSQGNVTDQVMDIAQWSTAQLSSANTGVEGTHKLLYVRNVQTQVVSGINYKMTVDLVVVTANNEYVVSYTKL